MEVQSIRALRLERFDAQRFLRDAGEEWFDRLHGRCRGGVRGDGMNALFGCEAKQTAMSRCDIETPVVQASMMC